MKKHDLNLFNDMKMELVEDLAIAYEQQAKRFNLSPTLPLQLFDNAVTEVTTTFKRLLAVHPTQFRETLFRIAVVSIASVPALAVVDERYAFALALSAVATEYQPKRPTPTARLQVVA